LSDNISEQITPSKSYFVDTQDIRSRIQELHKVAEARSSEAKSQRKLKEELCIVKDTLYQLINDQEQNKLTISFLTKKIERYESVMSQEIKVKVRKEFETLLVQKTKEAEAQCLQEKSMNINDTHQQILKELKLLNSEHKYFESRRESENQRIISPQDSERTVKTPPNKRGSRSPVKFIKFKKSPRNLKDETNVRLESPSARRENSIDATQFLNCSKQSKKSDIAKILKELQSSKPSLDEMGEISNLEAILKNAGNALSSFRVKSPKTNLHEDEIESLRLSKIELTSRGSSMENPRSGSKVDAKLLAEKTNSTNSTNSIGIDLRSRLNDARKRKLGIKRKVKSIERFIKEHENNLDNVSYREVKDIESVIATLDGKRLKWIKYGIEFDDIQKMKKFLEDHKNFIDNQKKMLLLS